MRGSTRAFSVGATGTRRIVQRRSYIECKCGALYSQILRFSISSLVDTTLPQPTIQLDSCPFGRSFFCSLYTPSQLFVVYSGFNDPLTPRYHPKYVYTTRISRSATYVWAGRGCIRGTTRPTHYLRHWPICRPGHPRRTPGNTEGRLRPKVSLFLGSPIKKD